MTNELKKIIFSPQISNVFRELNWTINIDSKKKFHSYFIGEIADYYLNVYNDKDKICLEFTIDKEIPKKLINELLILINIANKNSKEGFLVFDSKSCKIRYNLILPCTLKIEDTNLHDFLKINLVLTNSLLHNLLYGIHNLVYGEKIESNSLELLFMHTKGYA